MAEGIKEIHFEQHIEKYLTTSIADGGVNEYRSIQPAAYDKNLCLIPSRNYCFYS